MSKKEQKLLTVVVYPIVFASIGLLVAINGFSVKNGIISGTGMMFILSGYILHTFAKKKIKFSFYNLFSMSWLLIDGSFHLFSIGALIENIAPDAVIARGILGLTKAMPIWVHRVIGVVLVSSTIYTFYLIKKKSSKQLLLPEKIFMGLYNFGIAPFTIIIVTIGLILHALRIGVV